MIRKALRNRSGRAALGTMAGIVLTAAGISLSGLFMAGRIQAEEIVTDTGADQEEYAAGGELDEWMEDSLPPQIDGLEYQSEMELDFARCFRVYYYTDGYAVADIYGGDRFLVVPEDMPVPDGLDENIKVLQKPLNRVYLAATSAMSLYDALDALDYIDMSGTDASGWYVENAARALEEGDILFAGKYSEPDYELLLEEECSLALESTMIYHVPKVKEMIEDLGVPVLVEHSSYETHPLGRTEWIKLYGLLTDKEEEARDYFDSQKEMVAALDDFPNTEKTVAYFYVSQDDRVVVRAASDYVAQMIELAGGRYIFADLVDSESKMSSVNMTMEDFYHTAVEADYLVYNAAIDNALTSMDELLAKSELFADFKAVSEGNVWCSGKALYQSTARLGNAILDFHYMLTDGDESQMTFFTKISE